MPKSKKSFFKFDFKNSSPLLVILLIILSFFTGFLFFKVQNLQQGGGTAQGDPQQQAQEPQLNLDKIPKVTKNDHILGSLNADLILVEYADFECPFCKSFHPTMKQVLEEYGNKVAWVYRHFPLTNIHSKAQKSAEASECVAELGGNDAFWKFTDLMFERMPDIELTGLAALAGEIGLDVTSVQDCIDSNKYADKVSQQLKTGGEGGINGTLGTVIITKEDKRELIGGALPFDQVKLQLDNLLK